MKKLPLFDYKLFFVAYISSTIFTPIWAIMFDHIRDVYSHNCATLFIFTVPGIVAGSVAMFKEAIRRYYEKQNCNSRRKHR